MKNEVSIGFFEIEDILNEDNGSGKLIALASRPGMGKTTFMHHLLSRMVSLNESNVLLFSLEMSKNQVIERLRNCHKICDDCINKIYIDNTPNIDIDYIKNIILNHNDISSVFIDNIELVKNFEFSCEKRNVLSKLRAICKENNINIFYTCNIKRPTNKRMVNCPTLIDIDTDLAKTTDVIFSLWRKPFSFSGENQFKPASCKLTLLKNPFGDLLEMNMMFNNENLSYTYNYCEGDDVLSLRDELHLHTKLSDDVSVIGVREIFENAEKLGLKSIAFANLNNVQDFPEIMKYAKKYEDIKVIYGAEVKYKSKSDSSVYHLTLLTKNQDGIKELYKVISSISNELIDLIVLKNNRKNLLVGSCGSKGELFDLIKQDNVPYTINAFYDYFEIFPSKDVLECETNKKIFYLGEELGVPVVASSNAHCIEKEDKICCDIVRLAFEKEENFNDEHYLLNTKKMLEEFSYLGDYGAKKTVLENPQIITDVIEKVSPLKEENYHPTFENAYSDLESLCYTNAHKIYGNPLPESVAKRLATELNFLRNEKFATQYLLAKKLTTFARENRQITTVRGAVGSTLVAFLLGISEINPLSPHYYCDCHYFEVSNLADDGFDLPEKVCPICKKKLKTDGHNIPYEIFMGLNGDKVPNIDLDFPVKFMLDAKRFMEECFGRDKVVQAGTVSTAWDRIAKMYIEEYEIAKNTSFSSEEKENLTRKIIGVKRDVGMHPGGIMIIPQDMEAEDFTPLNQNQSPRSTTHFDFQNLCSVILKQDILGHRTLDLLLELEKQTGKSVEEVDFSDPKIYELFSNADTDDIYEFQNDFAKKLLIKIRPKTFDELVEVTSLCRGTNIWVDNFEFLFEYDVCAISDIPASRDDIFLFLTDKGMDKETAFRIMDVVVKGKWANGKLSDTDEKHFIDEMQNIDLPEWYIEAISKIRYMFPKAHSVSYVINAVRSAWYKIYFPKEFKDSLNKISNY